MAINHTQSNAPDAPLAAPKWGTFDEFVEWFMAQPDDRVFDNREKGRCRSCVIATWLSEYNKQPIEYHGVHTMYSISERTARAAYEAGVCVPVSESDRFASVANLADCNALATKRELLDLGIFS